MMNNSDLQHLNYLRIGHLVNAGLFFLTALFPVIYLVVGIAMIGGAFDGGSEPPPEFLGYFFIFIAFFLMAMFGALGVLNLYVARSLKAQKNWVFCIVMAAINLMFAPLGMILGVFSLIVLLRESVKQLFASGAQPISGQMPDWK